MVQIKVCNVMSLTLMVGTIPLSLRRLKEELNSTVQIKVGNVMSLTLMVGTITLSLRRLKEELNSTVQIKLGNMISDGWYDNPVTEKVEGGAELHGSDQGM